MDFHLARFMSYREDLMRLHPDETQTLIKYLLQSLFFLVCVSVNVTSALQRSERGRWGEKYTPSVPVRQALSIHSGRKIVVDKKIPVGWFVCSFSS